jgi:hypothetical protein
VELSEDSFRALARSSPWRWTSLHLRHRSGRLERQAEDEIEAWLTRPDGVRVVGPDGRAVPPSVEGQRPDGQPTRPWHPPAATYRPDGLVSQRPELSLVQDDGLFWRDYYWVAMLDPVELSHHVAVVDLHTDDVAGRLAWRARMVAEDGYEPRCGGNCCELLYSEAGLRADFPDPDEFPSWAGGPYTEAYDVALDVATGVVVRCLPIGATGSAPWLHNDILASL